MNLFLGSFCILLSCVGAAGRGVSTGGSFGVVGHVTGGGGISAGGSFALLGHVAFVGGTVSTGGNFALRPHAPDFFALPLGDFELKISLTDSAVEIVWPAEARGYVLERTSALIPGATWQAVSPAPTGSFYTTQPIGSAAFFRLRRP